jgi:hypothetical protein
VTGRFCSERDYGARSRILIFYLAYAEVLALSILVIESFSNQPNENDHFFHCSAFIVRSFDLSDTIETEAGSE